MTEQYGHPLPLEGLTVVDLSTTLPGAHATQFLADCGADVLHVERPGGSALRQQRGYAYLGRGKRSVVLDLKDDNDVAVLRGVIAGADALVSTWRPGAAERLGFGADELVALNPRLVSANITGFGTAGPWRGIKGYEALVLAKLGHFHDARRYAARPGPAYVSVPYASWAGAMAAVQGLLAALLERESSSHGQHAEVDLVTSISSYDTWSWYIQMIGKRYPDAIKPVEMWNDDWEPAGHFVFPLIVAPTADGRWLQFAQTQPHLLAAFFKALGLGHVFTDEYWQGFPFFEDQARRTELWELMLERVRGRTMAEWEQVFGEDPNVYAEQFRAGSEVLDHPQLVHNGRSVVIDDLKAGPVRQPSTLVHLDGAPLTVPRPAPVLDADGAAVRAAAAEARKQDRTGGEAPRDLPLAGVTVLELALMFAAPYASTMLTDLGARVIKVESLGGDSIRNLVEFPEVGGSKVMQGKESIALDIATPEGLAIVHELAAKADVVLMGYRAGVAERLEVDAHTLRALNHDLVYVNAPGYGTGEPCGHRPAYAPSIGVAAGFARENAPGAAVAPDAADLSELKRSAVRLSSAGAGPRLQADGVSAHGAAVAMLLGLVGRARHRPLHGELDTSMLSTSTHAMHDFVITGEGLPEARRTDANVYGLGALYRLYESADGWIFLAAPAASEWAPLTSALEPYIALADDPRFATAESRETDDAALAASLETVFRSRSGADWERDLTAADVGCVVVSEAPAEDALQSVQVGVAAGYAVEATSPMWDEHLRLAPLVRFSRSTTQALSGCNIGQHTDAVLTELGYDETRIRDLRERNVVAG